jgi:hypothetical protein
MIFKEIDNMSDVWAICHYLASAIRRYIIWRNKNHEHKIVKSIENRVNFL